MSSEFAPYMPYSETDVDRVWRTGRIVLDTNVLLHLYRADETLRVGFLSILEDQSIRSRLWFPHQVVSEFFSNRMGVIAGQLRALERLSVRTTEALRQLLENKDVPRFLIDRAQFESLLKEAEGRLVAFLDAAKGSYPATPSSDSILARITAVFDGRTAPAPDDTTRARMVEEGKRRFDKKLPPGFGDAEKPENGDYLVWAQCLEMVAFEKSDLLFVSDDKKDDWWLRVSGYTIGPRPELRKEFYACAPGNEFVLSTFDAFVSKIGRYLTEPPTTETVADAREFSLFQQAQANDSPEGDDFDHMIDVAVKRYRETAPTSNRAATKSVDAMVSWFLERYMDPANGVPYNGREGGYQYLAGGPYSAEEELREAFDNGTQRRERLIAEAVKRIENEGYEWVKRGEY